VTATIPTAGVHRTPRHLYYFNGRGPWPGVTTVIDVLDRPALVTWKRRQVALAAVESAERLVEDRARGDADAAVAYLLRRRDEGTNGRDRGTRIHETLESLMRRQQPTIHPDDAGAIEGVRTWLNENRVVPLEVEAYLIHETLGYGGTCDLIARLGDEIYLLDWKTSGSVADRRGKLYREHRLQLAAYVWAEFIARPGDPSRHPIPPITKAGIVHVTDHGTRLYPVDLTEEDWIAFRACLRLYQWRNAA
jgi:hypothetical protein